MTSDPATGAPAPGLRRMLPFPVVRSMQFTGANLTTLAVYAGLSGTMFLLALQVQQSLHYSPAGAGAALLPITALMLLLSPRMGALVQRTGPRLPMTAGPVIAAGGLALMARITPGTSYVPVVLPAVVVFGLGLSITVTPLTSAVLASVSQHQAGLASGINNAVARIAGLLAVAVLPLLAGISTADGRLGPGSLAGPCSSAAACAPQAASSPRPRSRPADRAPPIALAATPWVAVSRAAKGRPHVLARAGGVAAVLRPTLAGQ